MKRWINIGVTVLLIMTFSVGCKSNQIVSEKKPTQAESAVKETTTEAPNQDITVVNEATSTNETSQADLSDEEKAKLFPINFELADSKGTPFNLADHEGKILFLNFFTTWCGYCMDEMPEFQKTYESYKDDIEIVIVNVNFDAGEKSKEDVIAWYDDAGYTFPMVIDEEGDKTADFYSYIQGYPTTFIYGPDGSFLGYLSGALDEPTMLQIIEKYKEK